jgi:hypothetical protein
MWVFADAGGLVPNTFDIDDDFALAFLLAQTEIPVAGVTADYGNVPAHVAFENTKVLIERLGKREVPVYMGASCLLLFSPYLCNAETASRARDAFVSHALGVVERNARRKRMLGRSAKGAEAECAEEKIVVVILGPATSFTLAFDFGSGIANAKRTNKFKQPSLRIEDARDVIDAIHFVGGSVNPLPERNLVEEIISNIYYQAEPHAFLDCSVTTSDVLGHFRPLSLKGYAVQRHFWHFFQYVKENRPKTSLVVTLHSRPFKAPGAEDALLRTNAIRGFCVQR